MVEMSHYTLVETNIVCFQKPAESDLVLADLCDGDLYDDQHGVLHDRVAS